MDVECVTESLKKKQKLKRDIDPSILDRFWDLVDASDNKRLKAAEQLLTTLLLKQPLESCDRGKELEYVVKRLIRGLASSRECARLGFSTVLTHVLRTYTLYSVSDILGLTNKLLKVTKCDSKSDTSGILLGRTLVYISLIQSDLTSKCDGTQVGRLVKALLAVHRQKTLLQPICSAGLAQLISKVNKEVFVSHIHPLIESQLSCGWQRCDQNTLLVVLAATKRKLIEKEFLLEHWKTKNILCKANHSHVRNVLLMCTANLPSLHPVCQEIVDTVVNKDNKYFVSFCNDVLSDDGFQQSVRRKWLFLLLTAKILTLISTEDQIRSVLSSPLVSCIVHNVRHKELSRHCRNVLSSLVEFTSRSSSAEVHLFIIESLSSASSVHFDSVTNTKTVATIIHKMNLETCRAFATRLMQTIRHTSFAQLEKEESRCRWSINSLASLVTHPAIAADDAEFQLYLVQFLFLNAFFTVKHTTSEISACESRCVDADVAERLHVSMQEAFHRVLSRLASFTPSKTRIHRDIRPYIKLLYDVVQYAKVLLNHPENVECKSLLSDSTRLQWNNVLTLTETIHNEVVGSEKPSFHVAFELLFLHGGLQLFVRPDATCDFLQELEVCYKKATEKMADSETDSEPAWIDVLIDLLMSSLSDDENLVRVVVNSAFIDLIPRLTTASLRLIIDVLKPTAEADTMLTFSDDDNDEMLVGEVNDMSDEEMSADGDDDDNDDDDDSEADNDDEVDDAVRESIKSALGDAAARSDVEEQSDLDDETMFKLDEKLATAFRSLRKGSKPDKDKAIKLRHYKMRCLELIELFAHHCVADHMLVCLIVPLLDIIQSASRQKDAKEFGDRTRRVLDEVCRPKKLVHSESLTSDELLDLLSTLLKRSAKVTRPEDVKSLVSAYLFVLRIILGMESVSSSAVTSAPGLSHVHETFTTLIHDFCQQKDSSINHAFVAGVFHRRPDLAQPMLPLMMHYLASPDVRIFSRTQVCLWMLTLVNKNTVHIMGKKAWKAFAIELTSTIIQTVLMVDIREVKPRYFSLLLTLLHRTLSITKHFNIQHGASVEQLVEKLAQMRKLNKDMKAACNRLINSPHLKNADVTKKEADNKSQQRKRRHASSSANDIVNETSDVENQAHIELSEWTHSKKKKKKQK